MTAKIITGLIALGIACVIPFYFDEILFFTVRNIGLGWVLTTILVRLLVIILVAISIRQFFNLSQRLKKVKSWAIFMIALVPGFGISFIAPIYNTDYGMMTDGLEMADRKALSEALQAEVAPDKGYALYAFFTTNCPFCMAASQKLGANIDGGQTVPVYAIFPGTEEATNKFIAENDGAKFNTLRLQTENDSLFLAYAGNSFPSIFLVNSKGETEYHWTGEEMNYSALDYLQSLDN